jgi:serine/threonine protein kinase
VVITPEGRAKVLDFGLAARMPQAEAEAVTKTQEALPHAGMLVGTLAYMAPFRTSCRGAAVKSGESAQLLSCNESNRIVSPTTPMVEAGVSPGPRSATNVDDPTGSGHPTDSGTIVAWPHQRPCVATHAHLRSWFRCWPSACSS